MYSCHKYENRTLSQLQAVDCDHVFDDGVLMMYITNDLLYIAICITRVIVHH